MAVCENAARDHSGIGVPQCWDAKATRLITVYYTKYRKEGEHDRLHLCEQCGELFIQDAEWHGYKTA